MKCSVAFSVIFLLGVVAALAEPAPVHRFSNPLLDEVVAMSRAGLSDTTIVAYVKARRARLDTDLSADDLIRLQRAGVSDEVIGYIAGAADIEAPVSGRDERMAGQETPDNSDDATAYPVEPPTQGYDYPYYYDYPYAYGYPYWYAYSPYFGTSFFFGSGGRGYFRGHRGHFSGHGGHPSGQGRPSSGHTGHPSGHTGHSSGHGGGRH